MILTEFLEKVNLEKFCKGENITGYQYELIPGFGWVGYQDKKRAYTIFDIAPKEIFSEIYDYVIRRHPEYTDYKIHASKTNEAIFEQELKKYLSWKIIYQCSLEQNTKHQVQWNEPSPGRGAFADFLHAQDLTHAPDNGTGFISDSLMRRFPTMPWGTAMHHKKYMLIPYFVAPGVLVSLEYCQWNKLNERAELYTIDRNITNKFTGVITNRLLKNQTQIGEFVGCTWSTHILPWLEEPLEVTADMPAEAYLEVLFNLGSSKLSIKPADFFVSQSRVDEALRAISKYPKSKVQELEKLTGIPMIADWKKTYRSIQYVDKSRYEKRHDGYWEIKGSNVRQMTNFIMDIEKIWKKDKAYQIRLVVHMQDKMVKMQMSYSMFKKKFPDKCMELFLDHGLPIPYINPYRANFVYTLVHMFYRVETES